MLLKATVQKVMSTLWAVPANMKAELKYVSIEHGDQSVPIVTGPLWMPRLSVIR